MRPRICVLRAPGTNCDLETAFAFERSGAVAERLHLFRLLESPEILRNFQVLCIPGGFSYGDDLGAGVVFGHQLRGRLAETLREFLERDTLVLGICNGFQVLVKAGLLPNGRHAWPRPAGVSPPCTLTWNENGQYTALWVRLTTSGHNNVFLQGIDDLELPIAHAEGRLVPSTPELLDRWRTQGQLALRYVPESPTITRRPDGLWPYPINPNGSCDDVAGLSDPEGRVLGLMPHPERYIDATQHPQWTRRRRQGDGAGLRIFQNAVNYFRGS